MRYSSVGEWLAAESGRTYRIFCETMDSETLAKIHDLTCAKEGATYDEVDTLLSHLGFKFNVIRTSQRAVAILKRLGLVKIVPGRWADGGNRLVSTNPGWNKPVNARRTAKKVVKDVRS